MPSGMVTPSAKVAPAGPKGSATADAEPVYRRPFHDYVEDFARDKEDTYPDLHTLRLTHHPRHTLRDVDVQNKDQMDEQVSRFLGHNGTPAAVEWIFVENVQPSFFFLPHWFFGGFGPALGHAAVAFTRRDGSRCLFNIVGGRQIGELVDIWEKPFDYIYGVKGIEQKGGMFSRSMCVVRLQEWDPHGVEAIELYLRAMLASHKASRAGWHNCGLCIKLASWLGFGRVRPYGNCSDWLSHACHVSGLLRRPHTFPKAALVDMIETLILDCPPDRPRAQIVYYKQEPESRKARKWQRVTVWPSLVSPHHVLRNLVFWHLEPFADAVVTIGRSEVGKLEASVGPGRRRRPRWVRWHPFRHFHTEMITLINIAWIILGWPRADTPEMSALVARLLLAGLVVVINAVLY